MTGRPGRAAEQRGSAPGYPLLVLTVCLGGMLAPLNSTMLAVALPELRREFNVGHAEIAWLVSAYLIAMAVAQPLGGRLGDQLGRARVFRAGLLLFLVLSTAAAAAPGFALLIVLRTSQALVGAAVIPNGMAMLRESVPVKRLGRASGITGSAVSIAAAVGPLLGAALLAVGSWRLLFLMNVPLVVAGLISLALLNYGSSRLRLRLSLDWPGAIAFAAALVAVTVLLNSLRGAQSQGVLIAAVVAFPVFLLLFVHRQFAASNPIAEWRLFRIRTYAAATFYILLSNLVMYTTILAIPFFVEEVQGKTSLVTGILLGAVSVPVAAISPVGGRISDALGRRPLVVAGSILVAVASGILLSGLSRGSSVLFLAPTLGLLGTGLGLSVGPSNAAAIESAPRDLAGAAAGTNSMMRYIGAIVGSGILGAVLNKDGGAPGLGLFQLIFAVLLAMSVLALVSSFFVHGLPTEATGPARPAASPPELAASIGAGPSAADPS